MSAPQLAALLNERYGFAFAADRIVEVGRTSGSTLFEASNDEGAAVQVELFDTAEVRGIGGDVDSLDAELEKIPAPGAFRPRHAGVTEDGQFYVLREATVGTPLRDLILEKHDAGQTFTNEEARDLLTAAADAVDAYNAAGYPGFLARSINADQLLVQPSWSEVPVKLALVGPSVDLAATEDNLHDFWNVVAQVTSQPVDEQAAARHATAAGYLQEVTSVEKPESSELPAEASAAVAPRPQDGYRKPPEPYPSGYTPPSTPVNAQRNPWPWVIGALAAALVVMLVAWFVTTQRGQEWTAAEQEIAQAYPGVVAKKGGKRGWQGLECESAAPDAGQEAKIRCAGEELGVSVAKYPTQAARDQDLPGEEYATVLGSGECMIADYEIPEAYPQAFAMAPYDKGQFLFIVNGYQAEEMRLDLPVCE